VLELQRGFLLAELDDDERSPRLVPHVCGDGPSLCGCSRRSTYAAAPADSLRMRSRAGSGDPKFRQLEPAERVAAADRAPSTSSVSARIAPFPCLRPWKARSISMEPPSYGY
jgi:hypothetical protein